LGTTWEWKKSGTHILRLFGSSILGSDSANSFHVEEDIVLSPMQTKQWKERGVVEERP
jgi:hypothetical protein